MTSVDGAGADEQPTTYQQEAFVRSALGDESSHNLAHAIELSGQLDMERMSRALMALADRHEVLRAAFRVAHDSVRQVVTEATPSVLDPVDLSLEGVDDDSARLEALIVEDANRPMKLTRAPLWHTRLVRLADDRHLLLTAWHHAIVDGWSLGVLTRDLVALYGGNGAKLPPLTVLLSEYAAAQRASGLSDSDIEWWRELKAGCPIALPHATGSHGANGRVWFVARTLPPLTRLDLVRIETAARTVGASIGDGLRAAVIVSLWPWIREELTFGVVTMNRERHDLHNAVGLLADQLPVHVSLGSATTFTDVISLVQAQMRSTRNHAAPYGLLRKALGARVDLSLSINYMPRVAERRAQVDTPNGMLTIGSWPVDPTLVHAVLGPRHEWVAPLSYQLRRVDDGLTGEIWGMAPQLSDATLDAVAARFRDAVPWAARHPTTPL